MSCLATPVVAHVATTRAQCTSTRTATPTAARMHLRTPTVLRRATLQHAKVSAVGRRVLSNRRAAAVVVRAAADDEFDGYTAGTAFLFPGQGAQSVGMAAATCAELPAAKALFDKASEILGYDLLALCTDGPADKLNSTAGARPLSTHCPSHDEPLAACAAGDRLMRLLHTVFNCHRSRSDAIASLSPKRTARRTRGI